jgi:hypothetical protein
MALSARLRNVDLTVQCEHCGHLIIKKGVGSLQPPPSSAMNAKVKCGYRTATKSRSSPSTRTWRRRRGLIAAPGQTASESAVPQGAAAVARKARASESWSDRRRSPAAPARL